MFKTHVSKLHSFRLLDSKNLHSYLSRYFVYTFFFLNIFWSYMSAFQTRSRSFSNHCSNWWLVCHSHSFFVLPKLLLRSLRFNQWSCCHIQFSCSIPSSLFFRYSYLPSVFTSTEFNFCSISSSSYLLLFSLTSTLFCSKLFFQT